MFANNVSKFFFVFAVIGFLLVLILTYYSSVSIESKIEKIEIEHSSHNTFFDFLTYNIQPNYANMMTQTALLEGMQSVTESIPNYNESSYTILIEQTERARKIAANTVGLIDSYQFAQENDYFEMNSLERMDLLENDFDEWNKLSLGEKNYLQDQKFKQLTFLWTTTYNKMQELENEKIDLRRKQKKFLTWSIFIQFLSLFLLYLQEFINKTKNN